MRMVLLCRSTVCKLALPVKKMKMMRIWWIIAGVMMCSISSHEKGAMATLYEVGGQMGWTNFNVHTNELPNYDLWSASKEPFYPGDHFLFQYTPNFHTIHEFPNKSDYERCDFTFATQLDGGQSGTFLWVASDARTTYFGCKAPVEGFGYHCNGGQKVAIKIQQNVSSSPSH